MSFISRDFLLTTDTAKELYHETAAKLPVVDYDSYIPSKVLIENKPYTDVSELLLSEPTVCRFLRSAGADDHFINGGAPNKDKFIKFAECAARGAGSPVYHFAHIELNRLCGFDSALNSANAEETYEFANRVLSEKPLTPLGLLKEYGTEEIHITFDAMDGIDTKNIKQPCIRPIMCTHKLMSVGNVNFTSYMSTLAGVENVEIPNGQLTADCVKAIILRSVDRFREHCCKIISIDCLPDAKYLKQYAESDEKELCVYINNLLVKLKNSPVTPAEKVNATCDELGMFKAYLLFLLCEKASEHGMVVHLRTKCRDDVCAVKDLLCKLKCRKKTPKFIITNADPTDDIAVLTTVADFQHSRGSVPDIQHGIGGMCGVHINRFIIRKRLTFLAQYGNLSGFIGIGSESQSPVSASRHLYFRRNLCRLLGEFSAAGEFPKDINLLRDITTDICYNNAKIFFKE